MIRNIKIIQSLSDYISLFTSGTNDDCYSCGFSVFRGDKSYDFGIVPGVGRNPSLAEREIELFEEFVRFSHTYDNTIQHLSPYDKLALAQHHGVPTRLLDWSLSPLVAAYFATKPTLNGAHLPQEADTDAVVHVLHSCEKHNAYLEGNPFEVDRVRLFYPEQTSCNRMVAQHSVFTVQPDPSECLIGYMEEGDDQNWIDRLIIPKDKVSQFHDQLTFLGCNERTLFPDVEGLAQSLRHSPRTGHHFICTDPDYLAKFENTPNKGS